MRSTDGLVGLVLRIVRHKSDAEMTAYSSLPCAMASPRVPLFDAMFVITSGDFFLCLTCWFDFFLPAALLTAKVVNDVKFSLCCLLFLNQETNCGKLWLKLATATVWAHIFRDTNQRHSLSQEYPSREPGTLWTICSLKVELLFTKNVSPSNP